jgi:DNA-binding XRE family transcriptional regulator
MSKRPTVDGFREKALQNPEVKAEYDALAASFEIKRQLIAMRKKAGLTQEQMAELLGTKKSNISRLESLSAENSPRLSTIENYAHALGYALKVDFTQEPNPAAH